MKKALGAIMLAVFSFANVLPRNTLHYGSETITRPSSYLPPFGSWNVYSSIQCPKKKTKTERNTAEKLREILDTKQNP